MKTIFKFSSSLRILWPSLILFMHFANSVSNNSTKCYRRFKYTLPSWSKCDAGRGSNDQTADFNDKETMRLPRIDPVKIGFIREVQHKDIIYTLKTLSLRPPIFEIQNFLSDDECDMIIEMAKSDGMVTSETLWSKTDEVLSEGNFRAVFQSLDVNNDNGLDYHELTSAVSGIKDIQVDKDDLQEMFQNFGLDFFDDDKVTFSEFEILVSPDVYEQIKSYLVSLEGRKSSIKSRKSFSTFLDPFTDNHRQEFFEKLHQRIAKVTQLPIEMIRSSEALQVIKYEVGGHYHAHHDSDDGEYAPCCHLVSGDELCRPCRYATMFYYLNEPTKGGGTAFPFADNITYDISKTTRDEKYRLNLSDHCDKANLVYMPKKGAALFWYNHVIDDDTGWLGELDEMSSHGGCDVIQGVKWAANNWFNAVDDRNADLEVWKNYGNAH
ncbi:transmembrane prolyl 4-hydroxylase-like [Dendronephthya gigantea]|uniref:transmembrane prolyl 4-hydroxylase-like n=1 Tax=Dendronephthya gigantea TaxID=151771 RepID=UPI0010694A51|nr:transmembrane prolyl 4-hydroxylase-like [Dendronephthya gigantea]